MNRPTPSFSDLFLSKAANLQKKIVLPEGNDERCLSAVEILCLNKVFQHIYVMNPGQLEPRYKKLQDVGYKIEFIESEKQITSSETSKSESLEQLTFDLIHSNTLAKGRIPQADQIRKISALPLFQAGSLVKLGHADCSLAGMCTTTSDVIRAALSTVGLENGCSTVSGSFFLSRLLGSTMDAQNEFIFADCGVVVEPSVDQLVDIAYSSTQTWSQLTGTEPIVAFLSFSTKGSASHLSVDKMRKAFEVFSKKYPSIKADGELQFDTAFSKEIGAKKAPGSTVPGHANVFIFPDLGAGNISYKIAQRLGGFQAYGPILQGLSKSFSDLSRGSTVDDIVMSACIGALRSHLSL